MYRAHDGDHRRLSLQHAAPLHHAAPPRVEQESVLAQECLLLAFLGPVKDEEYGAEAEHPLHHGDPHRQLPLDQLEHCQRTGGGLMSFGFSKQVSW